MLLSEVFDYLTYGELAELSLGGLREGGVDPMEYPRIITNINLALIELYTEFPIRTAEVNLQLYEAIKLYTLHTDFAQSNTDSTQAIKYINDTINTPFSNDILVIDSVFNEAGEEYPVNEPTEELSVFTPTYNTIKIPFATDNTSVDILYRASPNLLVTKGIVPTTVDVPIPYNLLSCLISYTLHKIHSSIGSGEGNDAGMYFNKYRDAVALAKHIGSASVEKSFNTKLDSRGWV